MLSKNNKHPDVTLICKNCWKEFVTSYRQRWTKNCSNNCRIEDVKKRWLDMYDYRQPLALKARCKRSKNEILFSELCINYFWKNDILCNESIFNWWDADIIIISIKHAVLWNGIWHYKKIKKEHSLEQVQNRDNIKIKEIVNSWYIPYIIKDMWKYNKKFVNEEFNNFIKYIQNLLT